MLDEALYTVNARATRYAERGDPADVLGPGVLAEAGRLWREALSPSGTSFEVMHALARLHWSRCQALGVDDDGDELWAALLLYARVGSVDPRVLPGEVRELLSDEPVVDRRFIGPQQWSRRAVRLLREVVVVNDPVKLDEAIELFSGAVEAYPPEHGLGADDMSNLSLALRLRFDRRGDKGDLRFAVEAGRAAVRVTAPEDPALPNRLDNLSAALQTRAKHGGDIADVTEAIRYSVQAVNTTPPSHPNRPVYTTCLAGALRTRYDLAGDLDDLGQGIEHSRSVVEATPASDPALALYRANLGGSLETRFRHTGRLADLQEAVEMLTAAVDATPPEYANRPGSLSNLSTVLRTRFQQTGDPQDLDHALTAARSAVEAAGSGHPNRAMYLNALGNALHTLFDHTRAPASLDDAVVAYREAVGASPGHPHHAMYLSNLGNALLDRHTAAVDPLAGRPQRPPVSGPGHAPGPGPASGPVAGLEPFLPPAAWPRRHTADVRAAYDSGHAPGHDSGHDSGDDSGDDPRDLTDAREAHARAVEVAGQSHPERGNYLNNLGNTMHARFRSSGRVLEADQAIDTYRRALSVTPAHHPVHTSTLHNLANVLVERSPADTEQAVALWRDIVEDGTAAQPLRASAAAHWGRAAASNGLWHIALDGYAAAVGLLPSLASPGLDRAVREERLANMSGLATEAASCAIEAGDADRALELLEQGRGVLWSQLLDTRTDATVLRETDPGLADRLWEVEAALDARPETDKPDPWWDRVPDRRLLLAEERDGLLERIRSLPGLEDFRRPPRAAELRRAAAGGPVVIINAGKWRCDALAVTTAETRVIPLDGLHHTEMLERVHRYLVALQLYELKRDSTARVTLNMIITSTLEWLWRTIAEPVLTALGHTGPPSGGSWTRLWWCPTGPLALLPLHAAGVHDSGDFGDGTSVLDRVVSSYTPTLRALIESRARRAAETTSGRLLAVGMPTTPGLSPLPQVTAELELLGRMFPGAAVLTGEDATRLAVREALRRHTWAHLSCHGGQDLSRPSEGRIVLNDGALTVTDLASERFDQGEFAFLSACQTALGGVTVPDEAITLASALHYAGWRHVIGTLWSVGATTSAEITTDLYGDLTALGRFQPADSAEALYRAVRRIRAATGDQPSIWAPFVHSGI